MEYKYITEDNLINKQNYMYSEFGGREFLDAYIYSRDSYIEEKSNKMEYHESRAELRKILSSLESNDYGLIKGILDLYVKRFEVSKRLYNEYDENWKPTKNSSYLDIDLYIVLAEICSYAYKLTGCTKYLSCLLKLDDTLLSLKEKMTYTQSQKFKSVLVCERKEIDKLFNCLRIEIDDNK